MLLSKEKEKRLFNKIASGDKEAKDKIISSNLFLVESVSKKYVENEKGLSLSKLKELGLKGLKKAIEEYDPASEYKFSTYATWWIRNEIHKALDIKDVKNPR